MTPARRRRPRSAGFTLVELTVALLAGLIVAMGIVSLAKESTQTFHEEARSSAAEAALRTAVDRLRADLARAGYMSTGNIMADTSIARPLGAATPQIPAGMVGLKRLSAIRLYEGGSGANGLTLSGVQSPALAPDAIEIGGNLTSAEEFEVQMIMPANGNCQRVLLSASSPAFYRVAPPGDTQQSQDLRNVFQPVPAAMATQFVVRLVDDTGHTQFLATCPETSAAGFPDPGSGMPYVDVDALNTPILTAQQTGTVGGISGYASGRAWVNAVQIARWEITTATLEAQNTAQYANAMGNLPTGGVDPNKYDLVRSYLDIATGLPIPQTTELVAEYAVDLDFAFSVDNGASAAQPLLLTYAFEDDKDNDLWAQDVSIQAAPYVPGPQRIRSVRARVATRAALGDRAVNVAVNNYGSEEYLYRYCINTTPSCATNDGTPRWARVRTVTTEVALPNQSRNFY